MIFIVSIILLFIVEGCSTGRVLPINEFKPQHDTDQYLAGISIKAYICAVLTKDNREIKFDSSGGILYRDDNTIEGRLVTGQDTIINLNYKTIESIIISNQGLCNIFADSLNLMNLNYASYKWLPINARRGLKPSTYELNFDFAGVQIDMGRQLAQGNLTDGRFVSIPLNEIRNIKILVRYKNEIWIKTGIAFSKFTANRDQHPVGFSPSVGIKYTGNFYSGLAIQPELLIIYNRPENKFVRSEENSSWVEHDRFRQIAVELSLQARYKIKKCGQWALYFSAGPYYAGSLISKTNFDSTSTNGGLFASVWGTRTIQNAAKSDYGLSMAIEVNRMFNKKKIFLEFRVDKGFADILEKWNPESKLSSNKRFIYYGIEDAPKVTNLRLSTSIGIRLF